MEYAISTQGKNRSSSSIHCNAFNHMKGTQKTHVQQVKDAATEYHVYACEWTEDWMKFYVDGHCYSTVPITEADDFSRDKLKGMEGFRDPMGIIINNEIFTPGHAWCPKEKRITADDRLPIDYWVDWIRLYQKDGEEIRKLVD